MNERFIADVPASAWLEGQPAKAVKWHAEYNVAAWVRVAGSAGRVTLMLKYQDGSGEHSIPVDSADMASSGGSALLSGLARVPFNGRVTSMAIYLKVPDAATQYLVEELYVQRKGATLRREDKLISNY